MGLTDKQLGDIAFSRGMVEGWVEGPNVPVQVREHLKTLTDGYDRLREQVKRQEEQIARQEEFVKMQSALTNAQAGLLRTKDEDGWRERVSLEFDGHGACFVIVHSEEGESFGVGAAYQSPSLSGSEPTLETTPFSRMITLPYLKAIVKLLEVEGSRIPMTRSGSL